MHGYLSNKESFNYQIEFFSRSFRVIAIDITGFGESKKLPFAYSLDDYVDDIKKVLINLGISNYYLIAHSFGGRIAIKLATSSLSPNKLILTGSAGLKPKRTLKYRFKIAYYKLIKRFLSENAKSKFGSVEYKNLKGFDKQSYLKIVNEYLDEYLNKIKCNTLIIFGKDDRETPIYMAKKLSEKITNSTLFLLENAGHFCFVEKAVEFNLIANEFLRG